MRSNEEALRIVEEALGIATNGVDDAEVSLGGGRLGLTRFADNQVHQSVFVDRETMIIRVRVGGKVGRAETSDYSPQGVQGAARQARMLAELLIDVDDPVGFPEPQDYAEIDAHDTETERATALDRMAVVGPTILRAYRSNLKTSGYLCTTYGAVDPGPHGGGVYALANSKGLVAYHAPTRADLSVTMFDDRERSGWAQAGSFALGDLFSENVAQVAVDKALTKGTPKAIDPGKYDVILEPAAVASLLEFISYTAGASEMASGRSFLSGTLDTKITGDSITIRDDFSHELIRGAPFDVEGVARRPVTIIENGVATSPVYSHENAMRDGVDPTGHKMVSDLLGEIEIAPSLVMSGGDGTFEDLVASTDKAILVSRIWYAQLVDRKELVVTGLTRDGTFLVEKGEIVAPVRNMRFNIRLLDLLGRVDAMSEAVSTGSMVVPAVRAADFNFTGASDS